MLKMQTTHRTALGGVRMINLGDRFLPPSTAKFFDTKEA
jgi:hypothetical protein